MPEKSRFLVRQTVWVDSLTGRKIQDGACFEPSAALPAQKAETPTRAFRGSCWVSVGCPFDSVEQFDGLDSRPFV
jgi:hypothetical protein